jgi:hypothetical protein
VKRGWPCGWVLFVATGLLLAQEQRPPTLGPPPDQQPPTLGEPSSPAGPHAANTTDARKLTRIHTIFIESMDNGLAEKLSDQIGSKGPFHIVTDKHQADALLRGTCFDSARLKTVHSEVFLTAPDGASIWQDIVRQPYKPPPLERAVAATAEVIADDLGASLHEARDK